MSLLPELTERRKTTTYLNNSAMSYIEDNFNEKPVIVIDEKPDVVPGQTEGEVPVMIIENDNDSDENNTINITTTKNMRWLWMLGSILVAIITTIVLALEYKYYRTYINIGVPVSVKSAENIKKLQSPASHVTPEVIMTSDSILGVGMNIYELRGLKAEISFSQPDSTDTEVYLYSRRCDFTSYDPHENRYLGSLVVNGKELATNISRLGYCAMANNNVMIGVARDEKVKDYCIENRGSFFRQFILVSNGVLPSRFYLHGKVERRAIGRIGNKLYYIESHNKEELWAFADALREYGFIDAIHITGGTDYCYYRSADGRLHDIGDANQKGKKHKGQGTIPWLVFKKR